MLPARAFEAPCSTAPQRHCKVALGQHVQCGFSALPQGLGSPWARERRSPCQGPWCNKCENAESALDSSFDLVWGGEKLKIAAMAAGGSTSASLGELEAAEAALTAALRDANIAAVFGAPVDPAALPDYLDVISEPKDLGTILEDVEKSLAGDGPYFTAEDVYRDVQLTWRNCLAYNNSPADREMQALCKQSQAVVLREFGKAGLDVGKKASGASPAAPPAHRLRSALRGALWRGAAWAGHPGAGARRCGRRPHGGGQHRGARR